MISHYHFLCLFTITHEVEIGTDSKDVSQPQDVPCKAHGAPGCLLAIGAYRDAGEVDSEPGTFGHLLIRC